MTTMTSDALRLNRSILLVSKTMQHTVPDRRRARQGADDRLADMSSIRIDATRSPLVTAVLWALTASWAGVIFWFSSKPGSQIPGGYSEIGHLGEYFIFGVLLSGALRASGMRNRAAIIAIVIASLYGVTDEFHQHFVPMRTPDPADWALDTVGATIGATVVHVALGLRRRAADSQMRADQ
jgi:VanZ family protein